MRPFTFYKHIFFYTLLIISASSEAIDRTHPVNNTNNVFKVGVRAVNGKADASQMWTKTVDVLNQNISGYRFELVPIVGFHEMRTAAKNKKIDFILTNPYAFTELNKRFGVISLLTLNKKQPNGVASTAFASAIFARSDRRDINSLDDIIDKNIMGVHEEAFGGWLMALRELINKDLDPHDACREILFSTDNTHQSVVYSVLAGHTDIGVVRTGIIEQLIAQGKVKSDSIKVLNQHKDKLIAIHSTQHYPEWPFSVMPHVPSNISNNVFHALLNIQPDSPAAMAGKYVNWAAPLDYSEVYSLINEIDQQHITVAKIWNKHWLEILFFLIFILTISFYTTYLLSMNRKLALSKIELRQHLDHVEDIVKTRTEELSTEKAKADYANKAKSTFLSNMSHEIRTPLNAILGFSQILKMDAQDEITSDNIDEIMNAGEYLLSLINEILDLATIEAGKAEFNLEKISFDEVLKRSINIIAPLANKKHITINFNSAATYFVTADYKRLQQICINLLSNAIKYNKQDGNIDVVLEQACHGLCILSIKDSGIGIKPEFFGKVFEPFSRNEKNSDVIEGTGVGLVITKQLVEQMQGEIGFNSEYGIGTEFWVTLPALE